MCAGAYTNGRSCWTGPFRTRAHIFVRLERIIKIFILGMYIPKRRQVHGIVR